jgi:chromosome segregation protein
MPARLKSLEMQGYKTFASRTVFEFAEKITAVVGPNGSGKSNIADSLRWVLGEQSFSLLRGKKTEDMIFSGSELRPKAGMAYATIVFDNSDGWLPIDFSEVGITRRAYRDGTNEYLINGQRARLKDVTELLAQFGLAERNYTIIGQGLVDAALSLKAEERRRLFEEAAGIGLHRSRREEALRRLETTKRNLERVQDILAEIEPRLRSLEKQARRTQEYEQIRGDLQLILRDWYGFHWHRTQKEVHEARETARVQEAALEQARREQEKFTHLLAGHRDRIAALRAGLNAWHRQSAELHSRREALGKELAVSEERMRSLETQVDGIVSQQTAAQAEIGLLEEQAIQAEAELRRAERDLDDARQQVEAARKALQERQAERQRADQAVQSARQSLSGLNARQGRVQAQLAERKAQAERSLSSLQGADQAVEAAEKEGQTARQKLIQAQTRQQEVQTIRDAADQALVEARAQVAQAEADARKAAEGRAAASAELAKARARLEVLRQAEASLTGYAGGTRLLLQAARQAKLSGTKGALNQYLEVPAEIETAVAAALGEYADSVVLESEADSALNLLVENSARGVLLPIRSLKPGEPVVLAQEAGPGVVGVASRLVKAPAELRPAVDLLLGQIVIVRDRQTARWLAGNAGQFSPVRIVTLSVEVFLPGGPVIAGGSGQSGQNILRRTRELRELEDQTAAAEKKLAEVNAQVESLQKAANVARMEEESRGQAARQARQEFERVGQVLNQVRAAADGAARQLRWQQEQRDRLKTGQEQSRKEIIQAEAELKGLETEIEAGRDKLRQANSVLASLPLEDLQGQVMHWNTQAALGEQARQAQAGLLKERRGAVERERQSLVGLEARRSELMAAQKALTTAREHNRGEEGEIGTQVDELRRLIDPAEAELELEEKEQERILAQDAAARQALSIAESHHAQAHIGLVRRQEALQSLRRRVEEDFGLVAFDYAEDVSGPTPLPLDGMVEQLPKVTQLAADIEETLKSKRAQLRRMGPINPEARAEYQQVRERYLFMKDQVNDLQAAEAGVREVIAELDGIMQREFRKTFNAVASEFRQIFTRLFGGGTAKLILTDPDNLTNTGIDIEARLPGRRAQGLSLLSGGERSLTASALVFSLLKVSPTPFCVMDEVDAMLDEANVGRFRELLRELSEATQFIVVTHNRNTVQAADVIYGVTMGRDSASQVLSLKLDEVSRLVDEKS